jgi:beta-glucanase (GH16 family)
MVSMSKGWLIFIAFFLVFLANDVQSAAPAPLDPCSGSLSYAFPSSDASFDSIPNGWGSNVTEYLSSNTVISQGLTLSVTNAGCPAECAGVAYSGGGWQSIPTYGYGSFSFLALGPTVSGTGLSIGAAALGPSSVLEQIAVFLSGGSPNVVTVATWLNGALSPYTFFQIPFNHSQAYHNYTVLYTADAISFLLDGNVYYIQTTNIPPPPLYFIAYYSVDPILYGNVKYTVPVNVSISQIYYAVYPNQTLCNNPSTTTGSSTSTTGSSTTTGGSSVCPGLLPAENNFIAPDALDVIADGWTNGFALYYYFNTEINNGLTLTFSNVNCPSGCGGFVYTAGGWQSAVAYTYGAFSFFAKGSKIPGTVFSLVAAGTNSTSLEQIAFIFFGTNTTVVNVSSWHLGTESPQYTINLGFDVSADYHNYTCLYTPSSVFFYVDGVQYYMQKTNLPTGSLLFGAYYTANPMFYGTVMYSGLSYVYISQVAYNPYCGSATTSTTTSSTSSSSSLNTTSSASTGPSSASSSSTSAKVTSTASSSTGKTNTTTTSTGKTTNTTTSSSTNSTTTTATTTTTASTTTTSVLVTTSASTTTNTTGDVGCGHMLGAYSSSSLFLIALLSIAALV